ncbi:arsenic resistance protein [Arthrobacter sp. B10-11]|uniref:arsenic resistance protein n=1 Tax=Arthrobacter sp. B10-11 TaxID=3081160 RepID=UPI00295588D2|nr:bile acid:sodium symporter [Arthrobacter sp. B10-11]MDV8147017.1 bile acid:sodium symporter [Arthrobacter sp. B10-11]
MEPVKIRAFVAWMERRQIGLYLASIVAGGALGFLAPGSSGALELAINPVLGLLLYATFLGIPFASLRRAARDVRFMATLLVLNFAVVPLVVFGLSRFVAGDQALLVGVLLVLLTPCIDYVIVFSGLAGGASDRLLAAAPMLMLAQMLLLPLYLLAFVGPGLVSAIDPAPFVQALVWLIIVPLALAALTQWWAGREGAPPAVGRPAVGRSGDGTAVQRPGAPPAVGRKVMGAMQALMVPLMMATLAVVVGSQIEGVRSELGSLLAVVPLYAAFLLVMVPLGLLAARTARLDARATLAVVFSGATRNSLVVLPLALALPEPLALAALVVVTQTLVELVGMVAFVRFLPRLVPADSRLRH